ncbi:ATP-binding cassette domain-containing protein [Pseudomonadota bacterium]
MLNLTQCALRRGTRLLFQDATFTIHRGQKVGVTGVNGCGKSSLFALIRGDIQADEGEFSLPPKLAIAHVAQETPALERSAIDYVMDGDQELRDTEAALAQAELDNDGNRQAILHGHLEAVGGYTARNRAAQLLSGLGFTTAQEEAPVSSFSGGWRMRLNLAQALMCRSDLLLLDEPTNHLDLDAVIWLQNWLAVYPGTLLLISHDRDFLDDVTTHIAHIEQSIIELYTGNYSAFERRRAEKLAQQQSAYERQQREIAHIQKFVDRFRAKATKARQAQSRLKTLSRMEEIAAAHIDSPFHFKFLEPEKLPDTLLTLRNIKAGYGDKAILNGVKLSIRSGERIGLLGANGTGKSTLIKLLAGSLPPLAGEYTQAQDLRIGYFAQHQLEQLRPDESCMQHLLKLNPKATEQDLRDFLGGFAFNGDMATAPIAPFSGGEKARLSLALLVYQRPNLLLLDEPTNHLDIEMRHALGLALQEYSGALITISHDRHLLRSVTDTLLLVKEGTAIEYEGDLDDYRQTILSRTQSDGPAKEASENSSSARRDRKRQEAEKRQQLKPLRDKLKKFEKAMDKLQKEKAGIDEQLAAPDIYNHDNKDKLKELLLEQGKVVQTLEETEEQWLEVSEELEALSEE